jgi:hypothetical protein
MSYSMRLPEEEPRCECFYDEARDAMDRADCPFHCDVIDEPDPVSVLQVERKGPGASTSDAAEDAA